MQILCVKEPGSQKLHLGNRVKESFREPVEAQGCLDTKMNLVTQTLPLPGPAVFIGRSKGAADFGWPVWFQGMGSWLGPNIGF